MAAPTGVGFTVQKKHGVRLGFIDLSLPQTVSINKVDSRSLIDLARLEKTIPNETMKWFCMTKEIDDTTETNPERNGSV